MHFFAAPMEKAENDNETVEQRVRALAEEVIAGSPLFVVDVDVRGRKGSQVVEVFVDSDEALDVERLAKINREVGFLLDTEEVVTGKYHLTVSSPGLDRPLVLPRQYRKNIDRTLRVHYRKPDGSGNAEVVGALKAADDETIEVQVDNTPHRIPLRDVLWAKVQLPW